MKKMSKYYDDCGDVGMSRYLFSIFCIKMLIRYQWWRMHYDKHFGNYTPMGVKRDKKPCTLD